MQKGKRIWQVLVLQWISVCSQRFPALNLTGDSTVRYRQYYLPFAEVWLGNEQLQVAVDTDLSVRPTQLSLVMSVECSHCHGAVYDSSESRSFHNASVYESLPIPPIGSVEGWLASDDFALPFYAPLRMDFALVTEVNFSDYVKVEGVLGLGYCNVSREDCQGVVFAMQKAGMIEKLAYSLYLSYPGFLYETVSPPSNILFGTSDLTRYSTEPAFTYLPLVQEAGGWVVQLDAVWIDGVQQGFLADQVRFTTGAFLMLVPQADYLPFITTLINFADCGQFPNLFVNCPCEAQISHNLTFSLGGRDIAVPPAAYFYEVSTTQKADSCYFLIGNHTGTELVLGSLFQTQFYVEFDYEGQRVGLATAASSEAVEEQSSSGLSWWGWLMASFLILCTIGFLYFLCKLLKPKRRRKLNSSDGGQMLQTIGASV